MKDSVKILLLVLVLVGIIFLTIKINNSDIKPLITLNDKQTSKKKENKKEETKEEEKKEEEKKEEPTEETKPTEETPAADPVPTNTSILPDSNATGTILCSQAKVAESGTNYTIQYLAYYDRIGGTMTKLLIYTGVDSPTMTPEEKQELAKLLERELKNRFPSFTSQTSITDTQAQVLLTGTPANLLEDWGILDQESLEYYNFAPTLRYEGYTCTMN